MLKGGESDEGKDDQQVTDFNVLTLANHILEALGQDFVIEEDVHLFK